MSASLASSSPALRIVDTMPDFWEFWSQAESLSRPDQIALFREVVVGRHPELYTSAVLLGDDRPVEPAIEQKLIVFLDEAPHHLDLMRRLGEQVPRELADHVGRFLASFSDFRYDGAVYILVSLRSFDGAIRTIAGHPSLLFGIDEIARVYGPGAVLTVLFDHELFHVHHAAVFPDDHVDPHPLWHALWAEGLATHVSERLSPGVPMSTVLGLPSDFEERARPIRSALVRELRTKLGSTEHKDYVDFFSGEIERTDIPPRAGYYIGLLVARTLCSGVGLADAARWGGSALRDRIGSALDLVSASSEEPAPPQDGGGRRP